MAWSIMMRMTSCELKIDRGKVRRKWENGGRAGGAISLLSLTKYVCSRFFQVHSSSQIINAIGDTLGIFVV